MLKSRELYDLLSVFGINFFTGVPDSQLREFCNYLLRVLGVGQKHIIAPNEGNAVALAAGYHLATGRISMVYMQNSGLGNALNPIASLADPHVYSIPILYMIGWRGMPGVPDEPQHIKQGEITLRLLELLSINYILLGKESTIEDVRTSFQDYFLPALKQGRSVALVVKKGTFTLEADHICGAVYELTRERAIELILEAMGKDDVFVSTTGKISREVYEQRKLQNRGHYQDFLTVGSMGHASTLALQIAEQRPQCQVCCLDGDGAVLMHAGAMFLIGARKPRNYIHILLNNFSHESVGGAPTIASSIDFSGIARASGYTVAYQVRDEATLLKILKQLKTEKGPVFLEIIVNNNSRSDLGRPQLSPIENKVAFMDFLRGGGEL